MTASVQGQLQSRIAILERRLKFLTAALCASALAGVGLLAVQTSEAQPDPAATIIRARGIIIEDEKGRERILIGAPIPDPREGRRRTAIAGMAINDTAGYERFGLGLGDGEMMMGFDAPPGKGDDRNRERINIVADADGGSYIRFLNRKTQVVSFLRLDESDRFVLEYLEHGRDAISVKSVGFGGEKTSVEKKD